jgi:outer membrane protein OmpA-like peptidoglycan-associated protein
MKKSYFLVLIICLITTNTFAQHSNLLEQFIEKRNALRFEKPSHELHAAEDSLSIWFILQHPENEISLELLNGLIIQNRLKKEDFLSLFENINRELFFENTTYQTIEWKLQRFDEKLAEGRKLKDFTVFNQFHKPVKISSVLSKTKPTILVFCEANCMGCQYDQEYIKQIRNQIEQDYEIRFVYLEEHKQSAENHFSAIKSNDIFYVTHRFDSELAFLLSPNKTPTYMVINNQGIIVDVDFNIRYLDKTLPDYPLWLERYEKTNTVKLYHELNSPKILNENELKEFIKNLQIEKAQTLIILSYADTTGSIESNKLLSQNRANQVAKNIKELGIASDKIIIDGKGEMTHQNLSEARVSYVHIVNHSKHELTPGKKLDFLKLFFEGNYTKFLPQSEPYLYELLHIMLDNPTLRIRVEGHVCCTDKEEEGIDIVTGEKNLSWARAAKVKDFLVGKGIESNRIEIEGLAHKKPKYKGNFQMEGFNRRTEIVVLDY